MSELTESIRFAHLEDPRDAELASLRSKLAELEEANYNDQQILESETGLSEWAILIKQWSEQKQQLSACQRENERLIGVDGFLDCAKQHIKRLQDDLAACQRELEEVREESKRLKLHFDAVMQNTSEFRERAEQQLQQMKDALERFDDAIGTSWDCECGRTEYNDCPECQECGRGRPEINGLMHAARALLMSGKE